MSQYCRGIHLRRRAFLQQLAPVLVYAVLPLQTARAGAAVLELPAPKPEDVCPVCGAAAAQNPQWIATVLYQDGAADHFDVPKDFFKYLLNMNKYAGGRSRGQIARMGVTNYYDGSRIDAASASYVLGSDVLGPKGHDLVPLADEFDAKEFEGDHRGRRVLRFADITPAILDALDQGKLEGI
jgi:copper chaperone NosL